MSVYFLHTVRKAIFLTYSMFYRYTHRFPTNLSALTSVNERHTNPFKRGNHTFSCRNSRSRKVRRKGSPLFKEPQRVRMTSCAISLQVAIQRGMCEMKVGVPPLSCRVPLSCPYLPPPPAPGPSPSESGVLTAPFLFLLRFARLPAIAPRWRGSRAEGSSS